MTWAEHAKEMADAAERARIAGDDVAMIVLATRSAQAAQLAKIFESTKEQ